MTSLVLSLHLNNLFYASALQTSTPEAESENSVETEPSRVPELTCPRCTSERTGAPARKRPPSIMIMGSEISAYRFINFALFLSFCL